jgi:hypothetical protein
VVYARDVWMHRIDVARATGRDLAATVTEGDAVAVCRMLSGRDAAPEVRVTGSAEAKRSLLSARVVF